MIHEVPKGGVKPLIPGPCCPHVTQASVKEFDEIQMRLWEITNAAQYQNLYLTIASSEYA